MSSTSRVPACRTFPPRPWTSGSQALDTPRSRAPGDREYHCGRSAPRGGRIQSGVRHRRHWPGTAFARIDLARIRPGSRVPLAAAPTATGTEGASDAGSRTLYPDRERHGRTSTGAVSVSDGSAHLPATGSSTTAPVYLAAFGTLMALARRAARGGGSYLVRVSLAQTGLVGRFRSGRSRRHRTPDSDARRRGTISLTSNVLV
jgi:hypothetical protein